MTKGCSCRVPIEGDSPYSSHGKDQFNKETMKGGKKQRSGFPKISPLLLPCF